MGRLSTKTILFAAIIFLVLSITLAVVSLYTISDTVGRQTYVLTNSTFTLSPNETYRQGLGSFHGGENITIAVQTPSAFNKTFSILYPVSAYYFITNDSTCYCNSAQGNFTYTFTTSADYYDAVFTSSSTNAGTIHLQVSAQQPKVEYPYGWLNETSKIMFLLSLSATLLLTLKIFLTSSSRVKKNPLSIQSIGKKGRQRLLILLLISLVIWLFILAVNPNPLAAFENWYTDNARDSYVASLFIKDGFSVFSQPLGKLANLDNSTFKYVTWPQMPHLYPLGSILLFLPFGLLIQNGVNSTLIYKLEIVVFLVIATICVYFFLKNWMQKDMTLLLKLFGVYIIYVSLIVYAADGMFDSVAFIFSLFAIFMFLTERYDYFFLLVAVSAFFKYQAGIFLLPLIVVGIIRLFQKNKLSSLATNKAVVAGVIFGSASLFTAYLSAPYLIATSPQLIMNGINVFSTSTQVSWSLQSFSVLLTLAVTVAYAVYMLNKNSLLSLSAFFLLIPSFLMPYFQNWYFPFLFVYALIPQQRKELDVTVVWLVFLIVVLGISGANYQPIPQIAQYLQAHLPYLPSPIPHLPQSLKVL
jgi:hypothetical protein